VASESQAEKSDAQLQALGDEDVKLDGQPTNGQKHGKAEAIKKPANQVQKASPVKKHKKKPKRVAAAQEPPAILSSSRFHSAAPAAEDQVPAPPSPTSPSTKNERP